MRVLPTVVVLAFALAALPPAEAAPGIAVTSSTPQPGDYVLTVSVSQFTLKDPQSGRPNQAGEGHIHYLLNGAPCQDSVRCPDPYDSSLMSYQYKALQAGDKVGAELVNNDHSPRSPRVLVERTVPGNALEAPRLRLAGDPPIPGDFTFRVAVENFDLKEHVAGATHVPGEGHIHYYLRGLPCSSAFQSSDAAKCGGDYDTHETTYSYENLAWGDRIGAELVTHDHKPLSPRVTLEIHVRRPNVVIVSDDPVAGNHRMDVAVAGVDLLPPDNDRANVVGEGHLMYLLNGAECIDPNRCGAPARTTAKSYPYMGLRAGDRIGVRVVQNDGSIYDTIGAQVEKTVKALPVPIVSVVTGPPNVGTDYTMDVVLLGGKLVPPGTTTQNVLPEGHLVFLLNGNPCADANKCSGNAATADLRYTFKNLVQRDLIGVEFVQNNGASYDPPSRAILAVTTPTITVSGSLPRAGDVNLTVSVTGFTLLPPMSGPNNAGHGHIKYYLVNETCTSSQCELPTSTDATSYPFKGIKNGQKLGAELVHMDGTSLSPPVRVEIGVLNAEIRGIPGPGFAAIVALLGAAMALRRR